MLYDKRDFASVIKKSSQLILREGLTYLHELFPGCLLCWMPQRKSREVWRQAGTMLWAASGYSRGRVWEWPLGAESGRRLRANKGKKGAQAYSCRRPNPTHSNSEPGSWFFPQNLWPELSLADIFVPALWYAEAENPAMLCWTSIYRTVSQCSCCFKPLFVVVCYIAIENESSCEWCFYGMENSSTGYTGRWVGLVSWAENSLAGHQAFGVAEMGFYRQ